MARTNGLVILGSSLAADSGGMLIVVAVKRGRSIVSSVRWHSLHPQRRQRERFAN